MHRLVLACALVAACSTASEATDAATDTSRVDAASDAGLENDALAEDGAAPEDAAVPEDATASVDSGPIDETPPVWAPCDTQPWYDGYPLPAAGVECTSIEVPLDHDDPQGSAIALRVARAKSNVFPSGRAVFQLAGGPGGTSVGQSGIIPRVLPGLLADFDLIYVDQRGTGGSGYMDCRGGYPRDRAGWEACGREHAGQPLDHYRTVDAAHDLEWVRRRLRYDRISLRGGSYGTRLALELMRQHPNSLEAVVLDGVDPPDDSYFRDFTVSFDRGVDRLVADCAASPACRTVSPTLASDLQTWRDRMRSSPRPITVGGTPTTEDEQTFLDTLSVAVGDSYYRFSVPRALHAIVNGSSARWNALMGDIWGATIRDAPHARHRGARALRRRLPARGQPYVAPGLFMTVLCAESLPNAPDLDALDQLAATQRWGGHDTVELGRACAAWTVSPLEAELRTLVHSDVPVLLMNGDLDINTFPEAGAHAAMALSKATNLVVPYATHSTMSVPCAGNIMTEFLRERGDMSAVDTSCLSRIPEPAW